MILCLGTTPVYQRTMIFDRVTPDAVNRAKTVLDYASGKSINAARVAHTLGHQVLATGFLGGRRGEALRGDLDAASVPHDFVSVSTETRQCITVVDSATGQATELVEESSKAGPDAWQALDAKLDRLLPAANVWVFSGTLAPDAQKDFYARRLPMAARVGARAIIDVVGEPLRLAMSHANAILKMNREELARTLGKDLSLDSALLAAVHEHTPPQGALIVTLGAAGAIASDSHACWRATSPKIEAVSAIGSGDAFAAGLAIALHQDQTLDEALRLATACGAANATTPRAGFLDPSTVARLAAQVELTRI